MSYDENYTLHYVYEKDGKLLFDVIDGNANNMVLSGSMEDLQKILKYSDLSIDMPFETLQDSIFNNPIAFIAKRKPLKNINELDFTL